MHLASLPLSTCLSIHPPTHPCILHLSVCLTSSSQIPEILNCCSCSAFPLWCLPFLDIVLVLFLLLWQNVLTRQLKEERVDVVFNFRLPVIPSGQSRQELEAPLSTVSRGRRNTRIFAHLLGFVFGHFPSVLHSAEASPWNGWSHNVRLSLPTSVTNHDSRHAHRPSWCQQLIKTLFLGVSGLCQIGNSKPISTATHSATCCMPDHSHRGRNSSSANHFPSEPCCIASSPFPATGARGTLQSPQSQANFVL